MNAFKGRFDAERAKTLGGAGTERLVCEEVFFLRSNTRTYSADISETRVYCDPVGVLHAVTISDDPPAEAIGGRIVFWLTPSSHLAPVRHDAVRWDGSCEVNPIRLVTARLSESTSLTFNMNYVWQNAGEERKVRRGFLVGESAVGLDAHDPAKVKQEFVPLVDRFLALASFASSRRVVCTGWQVSGGKWFTRYYRGGVARPGRKPPPVLDQGLIPRSHFQQFIDDTWPRFMRSPYRSAITSAIHATVPGRRQEL